MLPIARALAVSGGEQAIAVQYCVHGAGNAEQLTGACQLEDAQHPELGLSRQELKALRAPLERCGTLVTRPVIMPASDGDGNTHSSELSRWDQAYHGDPHAPHADPRRALGDLVAAAVRAAVLVPEPEAQRWFSWQWYWTNTLIADLIRADRLRRNDGHLTRPPHQPDEARPPDCPR